MPSPEAPPQSYFPRCRVRLIIRFEEFGRVFNTPAPPKKPPQIRTGKGVDNKSTLNVVKDGDSYVLRPRDEQNTARGGSPQDQTSSADNRTHVLEGIIPIRCTISRNGIRTADTCTIELHTLDFPFDPRVIRSCGVQVYLGCVTEQDVQRETSGGSGPNVNRSHQLGGNGEGALVPIVCPDEFTDDKGNRRSNLRFEGFVDMEDVEYPNGDASTVKLEATDNTRLLIDQDAPPKLTVTADQPLDIAVANYLANFPQFRGLRVEYRPAGADVPLLKAALAKSAFKPNAGPPPTGGAGAGGGGQQKVNVWDYLTDIAGSLGLIVRIEGVTIIFQRPRTLYASKFSGRPDDPFTGRTLASGRFVQNRLYIYGRNIEDLNFARKLTKFAPTNVEVRCFGPETLVKAGKVERAYRRPYSGPMIRITTANGGCLSGTPNHPVLCLRGWVPLNELVVGDDLVCGDLCQRMGLADPHVDAAPTKIGEVFDSLSIMGVPERRAIGHVDFHGDGSNCEIDVVAVHCELRDGIQSPTFEKSHHLRFESSDDALSSLQSKRSSDLGFVNLFGCPSDASACEIGCSDSSFPSRFICPDPPIPRCAFERSRLDSPLGEKLLEGSTINPVILDEFVRAHPGLVRSDKIIDLDFCSFDGGHVFNLQTESGYYVAEGFIVHNCYSGKKGQTLTARFPTKEDRQKMLLPGDAAEEKWTVFTVSGVEDLATLRAIAQSIYEGQGRQELVCKFKTHNLGSFGGGNLDPDALDVQAGDPIEIEIQREIEGANSIGQVQNQVQARAENYLRSLGYGPGISKAYGEAIGQVGLPTTFRVRTLAINWDSENEGVSFDFESTNFIEVRQSANLPAGEEINPSGTPGATAPRSTVQDKGRTPNPPRR